MAEQAAGNNGFMKSFLPGLALGLVIGALAGAFIGPMLSNPPEPVARTKGGTPVVIPPPPAEGAFDERAPVKADPAKGPTQAPEAPPVEPPKAPESSPVEPPAAPK